MTAADRHTGPGPVDPEQIDAAWLGQALGVEVAAASGRPVGTGQVASTWRFELSYDHPTPTATATRNQGAPAGPESVVVKTASPDPTSRAAGTALGLYEKEVGFYRHLAGRVGIRTPHCYYATTDLDTDNFALVLEDLSPSAPVDQLTGLSPHQVALALDQLAALHAPLWGDPSIEQLDWLSKGRVDPEAAATFLPMLFDQFLDRHRDALTPGCRRTVETLRTAGPVGANPARPFTVIHADYRADNLLFEGAGGRVPVAAVDWQTVTYGAAGTDLSFVIGTSLSPADRRQHQETLVRRYHDALVAQGVRDYDAARCWEEYRRWASYGVLFLVPSAVLVERTERGDAMFLSAIERSHEQMADLGTLGLLGL